ncbi:MAG TPA: hypothetical protein VMR50_01855 [Myxococcota bacterium]|nr:hypothetical protein [Myxococcota bacterium]
MTITSPANHLLTKNTPVTVSGAFGGTATVTVKVNGVTATKSGSSYSASVPLTEGSNTLTATATNSAGSASASVQVTLDRTAPTITVTAPGNNSTTAQASIVVTGTVTDANGVASVKVNGTAVTLSGSSFSSTVALALGSNTITVSATDAAGNTCSTTVAVTRVTGPSVTIGSPANGLLTRTTPITVSGTFGGTATVTVKVNGVTATKSGSSYSASVPLSEGANTLTATATNAGGSASASVQVTLDRTPPTIVFTSPPNNSTTGAASVVVTGTVTDASPITSFKINGNTVVLTNGAFSTTVSLAVGSNTITAVACDAAGNTSTASLTVTRANAPTVTISAPANGLLTRNTPTTVTGSFGGASPVAVSVNGVAATLSGSTYSASVPLTEGSNTLTATATNAAGSATASVTIKLDTTPPVVTITSPANGTVTAASSTVVTGTVTDANPITSVTVNGAAVTLTNGAFSTTVSLVLGANPIAANATDAAGNVGTAAISVTRAAPPTVAITAPANGSLTRTTPAVVTGTSTGTTPITVSVNGVAATVTGTSYSATVPLSEGSNTLTATATNAVGTANASSSVMLDTTPPVVAINTPADGATLATGSTVVTGTVTDASPITTFTVNGAPVTLSGNAFTTTVSLTVGANPITASATDAAGNVGTAAISVTRAAPPTVVIGAPVTGLLTRTTPAPVTGTFTGTTPVTVSVNGVAASVTGTSYSATVPLTEGQNTLTVTATNAAGTANASTSVVLDTTPPVVVINAPADGATLATGSTAVTGTVTDASPIATFTVNGAPVALSGSAFTTTQSLTVGANPITASATDAAGNTGTSAISVTRATPPTIAIGAPADGLLTAHTPIDVTGTVSGTPPISVNVNGIGASVTGSSFTAHVTLSEGANTLMAIATNLAGSVNASVAVTLDTTPPVVTITSPPNGAVFSSASQTLAGTVTDASPIASLVVAGAPAPPGNAFSQSISLAPGPNPFAVQATDTAGNIGTATVTVSLANQGPPLSIAIQSPPDHSIVSTPYLPVSGTVSDPNAAVSVNAVGADTTDAGFVAPVVVLSEGDNQLVASAVRGGETATDTVTVRYEKPPTIFILHPANGTRLREAATDVSGFVDDLSAAVSVNGIAATVNESGGFVARGVPLVLGDNTLNAQAVSLDGLVGTDTAKVTRDDALPQVVRLVLFHPFGPLVVDGFDAFVSQLQTRGLSPSSFSPPLDRTVISPSTRISLFVFTEDPGEVTVPEVEAYGAEPTQTLAPISELDPADQQQVLPLDFAPRFYAVYDLHFVNENPE